MELHVAEIIIILLDVVKQHVRFIVLSDLCIPPFSEMLPRTAGLLWHLKHRAMPYAKASPASGFLPPFSIGALGDNLILFILCYFLSSQKVTKKDLTKRTRSAFRLRSNSFLSQWKCWLTLRALRSSFFRSPFSGLRSPIPCLVFPSSGLRIPISFPYAPCPMHSAPCTLPSAPSPILKFDP
jgi:hypothetical protein